MNTVVGKKEIDSGRERECGMEREREREREGTAEGNMCERVSDRETERGRTAEEKMCERESERERERERWKGTCLLASCLDTLYFHGQISRWHRLDI